MKTSSLITDHVVLLFGSRSRSLLSLKKLFTTTSAERIQKAFELRRRGGEILPAQPFLLKSMSQILTLPVKSCITIAPVSKADVLNNMIGKSVCFGWDAVFSMTAKQINDNLYDQYTDQVNNPNLVRNAVRKTKTSEGDTTITAFNFVFKAPKLQ